MDYSFIVNQVVFNFKEEGSISPVLSKQLFDSRILFGHFSRYRHYSISKSREVSIFKVCNSDIFNPLSVLNSIYYAIKGISKIQGIDNENIIVVFSKSMQDRRPLQKVIDFCNRHALYYMCGKWRAGLLTNFNNTKKILYLLNNKSGEISKINKNNKSKINILNRKICNGTKDLSGILSLGNLPALLISFSAKHDYVAIKEARKMSIKVVALVDSDANVEGVDFPIFGNDDIESSILLYISILSYSLQKRAEGGLKGEIGFGDKINFSNKN